jgi:hypothetical protein
MVAAIAATTATQLLPASLLLCPSSSTATAATNILALVVSF